MASEANSTAKRTPFSHNKDDILLRYKRTLGAFQESFEAYRREYGVPFDHTDEYIPEVFKHYFQLVGMRQVIQDQETIAKIHEELAEKNDYWEWDC